MMHNRIVESHFTFKEALSYAKSNFQDYTLYDNAIGSEILPTYLPNNRFVSDVLSDCLDLEYDIEDSALAPQMLFLEWSSTNEEWQLTDLAYKVLQRVISRFAESYCIKVLYNDDYEDELSIKVKKFINNLVNVFNNTYEKYEVLYNIYQDNKNTLMRQLSVVSNVVNKFNDTPQDSGNFEDEDHTTNINITNGSTSTDDGTPMTRIDEIDRKLKNLFLRWSNEFRTLFWEE